MGIAGCGRYFGGERHLVIAKRCIGALRLKRWLVHQRTGTPRPRVQARQSRTTQSNHRWARDVTHIPCGQDGLGHLTAVIDCHDREIMGYEFA